MMLLSQNSKLGKQQYYSTKQYIIYDICDFKTVFFKKQGNYKYKIQDMVYFLREGRNKEVLIRRSR